VIRVVEETAEPWVLRGGGGVGGAPSPTLIF
jgi:hypothetical protein